MKIKDFISKFYIYTYRSVFFFFTKTIHNTVALFSIIKWQKCQFSIKTDTMYLKLDETVMIVASHFYKYKYIIQTNTLIELHISVRIRYIRFVFI